MKELYGDELRMTESVTRARITPTQDGAGAGESCGSGGFNVQGKPTWPQETAA